MKADQIPDDLLEHVVGRYWDYLGEQNREWLARMGMEPGWWADKPDYQKRAEKGRFAMLLEIAWPLIAQQVLNEEAEECDTPGGDCTDCMNTGNTHPTKEE